jgi:hypothetical protein
MCPLMSLNDSARRKRLRDHNSSFKKFVLVSIVPVILLVCDARGTKGGELMRQKWRTCMHVPSASLEQQTYGQRKC